MKLPRPKLPRPKRPTLPRRLRGVRPGRPSGAKLRAGRRPRPPGEKGGAGDLWFRASTRVRAVGYWIREKAQDAAGLARRAGERSADVLWLRRSRDTRARIGAVAAVLAVYALVKFVALPGVPCQLSAVKECAPPDDTIVLVPDNALFFAHVSLERDSQQYERAADAFESLSDLRTILAAELPGALPTPSGAELDVEADVLPWAEQDLAVALLPGPEQTSMPVFVAGVGDTDGAEQFLAKIAPPGEPQPEEHGEATISVYPNGFAAAYIDDNLAFGNETAVRVAVDVEAGTKPALEDSDQDAARERLPDARFAEIYLSRQGVERFLADRPGTASQLETFIDYGATSGAAAALVAREEGMEIELVSRLDPELIEDSPSFFSALPEFEPDLADEAGSRAIGYVGIGEVGPTFGELLGRDGAGAQGLVGSLQSLASRLEQEAGVNPLSDLLPALGGQAAVVAEPTDGVPFASLIVDGVDEQRATEALAGLQKPLLGALGPTAGAGVPSFQQSEVEGVTVHSVEVSPTVNLSYGVFDGKLVVSTDPAGVAQVRAGGEDLADSQPYERATSDLPEEVSALVFLNLDELFGQVTRTDLVEDPFFANLSVLFENASSLGLAVEGSDEEIHTELFLALD